MIADLPRWERRLLALAQEGVREPGSTAAPPAEARKSLQRAYRICEAVTAEHSRSFHLASRFLPAGKRRAIRALYAFCRITDDIVDEPRPDAAGALRAWRAQTLGGSKQAAHPVALAWRDTQQRFQIPVRYAEQLVEGVSRDLRPARYASFDALAHYCYGVASTVGLMSMHIIGFSTPQAVRYAVKLGVALQLTNILRDVGEDLRRGRLYLPLDELAAFDVQEDRLREGRVDLRWRSFMQFQVRRVRRLFREARPGIPLLHRDGRFAVAAAAELYGGILGEVEANGYNVLTRRAHLTATQKLLRLPTILRRASSRADRSPHSEGSA